MNLYTKTLYCSTLVLLTVIAPVLTAAKPAADRSPCGGHHPCIDRTSIEREPDTAPVDLQAPSHQVLLTAVADTMAGYFRTGGTLRLTFALYRRYSLGFRTGILTSSPDMEVPIDIVNAWDFTVGQSRVALVFNVVTGISAWWDDHISERLPILNLSAEFGIKVRINSIVGVAALFHIGCALPHFRSPKIVFGGQLGPVFYF